MDVFDACNSHCVVSPCCRHKPFGVTAILVRMSLMSVISIFLCMAMCMSNISKNRKVIASW